MKSSLKFFSIMLLLTVLTLTVVMPVQAFDGRAGEKIFIAADEVIADDLYANANEFVLDGTIKGDLVVFGTFITINGTVEGDVIAAGQTIVINGKVADDARIAGAILQIGEKASIGGDLVSAGASLEVKEGAKVGGELVVGAGQALLAGEVTGDVLAGSGSLELRGLFGGDINAEVGDPNPEESGPPMSMFFPQSEVSIPSVKPGLTVSENAKIKGNFEYTQSREIKIPANVVGGKITRNEPVLDPNEVEVQLTPAQLAMQWVLNLLRTIVTLILLGLLLGWLAPSFVKAVVEKAKTKTSASFGWGFVTYAAFFFAILVIVVVMIAGGILFGALTLGGISAGIIWVGILALFGLILAFVFSTTFISKIIVAWLGGKAILNLIKPDLAENKFAPLILGVIVLAVLMAIPFIGWVFSLLAVLIGLGAIWLWGSDMWQARKAAL